MPRRHSRDGSSSRARDAHRPCRDGQVRVRARRRLCRSGTWLSRPRLRGRRSVHGERSESRFQEAVTAAVDAYRHEGFGVETALAGDGFVRLLLTSPDGRSVKVELGIDWRAHAPVTLAVGPVLHPDDAVGNKVAALYGRAEVRDFVDVEAILRSGRYTTHDLLRLAANADPGFDPEMFLLALNALDRLPDQAFAVHGLSTTRTHELRQRFKAWTAEIVR
ncbi:nucleotidyl transferase AbiEii/AbiGii toxin family protein [Actinocorallia sp. B10E7]|uniref:nucleotidyl transferase AbiEii/AbiGii toxin family protein n=1 Tax=Actinocorallia sp. B10E7 TaxID=3153558 RepID=UPI00325CB63D